MKRLAKILLDSSRPPERFGPKTVNAGLAQPVADAGGDRRLRTEHDEIDASRRARVALSPLPSVAAISQFSPRDAVPALPGAAKIALARRRLREPPRKRVLARTVTDDEDAHACYSHSTVAGGFVVMS